MPKKPKTDYGVKTLADLEPITFITSGVPEIDKLTRGIPRGRVTELSGLQGVGKTHLMYKCIGEMSKAGKVLYFDVENAMNSNRLIDMGANSKNVDISNEAQLENVAEHTIDAIGKYDVIIIDSVAALVPKPELEAETGSQHIGLKARLMGQWMRKIIAKLGKSKTAMVFINQIRLSPDMYIPKFTPGGKALPYASSLRFELTSNKNDRIKAPDGSYSGHIVNVEVTKSKVSRPYLKTSFKLEY